MERERKKSKRLEITEEENNVSFIVSTIRQPDKGNP